MNQRTNFCLYYGESATKLAKGWLPVAACSGEPGRAKDHVHISAATFERLKAKGAIVVWDENLRIVSLPVQKAQGEQTEAPASTLGAVSIPHPGLQPSARLG